ncbi:hypothetical protein PVAND_005557 [Polypedilum vanderplanki]|uniref:Transmembrane protein n=1 Tax=Polypedilum vanderplanki TaxID=319348 RepID=A0A9J6C0V3_POLVA|nr:hypothetical protein PVAND_005557 [Polypedilum vanderplanki]
MNENKEDSIKTSQLETVTVDPLSPKKQWVKFDDENQQDEVKVEKVEESTKQLNTKYNEIKTISGQMSQPAVIDVPNEAALSTIELPKIKDQSTQQSQQQTFNNGDVIVTLLPVNEQFPWITPATFRPELVPEELMAQGLTLTVEEYVNAMEMLVNDYRFTLYNICYKRVLMLWITLAFIVLLGLLFSGITGILLFSLGVSWLFLNAVAIFFCMWLKMKLARGLEKCLARVNKMLLRHKIIIALDDRGNISCHKVHLCFIYFDSAQCISYINNFLERRELNGVTYEPGWESRFDIDSTDIVIQGSSSNTRISRQQVISRELILRYMQMWSKDLLRHRLSWTASDDNTNMPRHLTKAYCCCQYVEEVILQKETQMKKEEASCCASDLGHKLILRYAARWGKLRSRNYIKVTNNDPARHMSEVLCPCQFIESHLKCKPQGSMCWPTFSNDNHLYPY